MRWGPVDGSSLPGRPPAGGFAVEPGGQDDVGVDEPGPVRVLMVDGLVPLPVGGEAEEALQEQVPWYGPESVLPGRGLEPAAVGQLRHHAGAGPSGAAWPARTWCECPGKLSTMMRSGLSSQKR